MVPWEFETDRNRIASTPNAVSAAFGRVLDQCYRSRTDDRLTVTSYPQYWKTTRTDRSDRERHTATKRLSDQHQTEPNGVDGIMWRGVTNTWQLATRRARNRIKNA